MLIEGKRKPPTLFENMILNVPVIELWETDYRVLKFQDGTGDEIPAEVGDNFSIWYGYFGRRLFTEGSGAILRNDGTNYAEFSNDVYNIDGSEFLTPPDEFDCYMVMQYDAPTQATQAVMANGFTDVNETGPRVEYSTFYPMSIKDDAALINLPSFDFTNSIFGFKFRTGSGESEIFQQNLDNDISGNGTLNYTVSSEYSLGDYVGAVTGLVGKIRAILYTPPISTEDYNAYIKPYFEGKYL